MSHGFQRSELDDPVHDDTPAPDPTPQGPSAFETSLQEFLNQLGFSNERFLGADFEGLSQGRGDAFQSLLSGLSGDVGGQLGGIGNQFLDISQGNDPRFAEFRNAQLGLLAGQRQRGRGDVSGRLARTGIKGTAAQNELTRFDTGFDERARAFSSGLGIEQLGRQDRALGSAAGVFGQRSGILSGLAGQGLQGELAGIGSRNQAQNFNLEALQTGLQNLLAEPGLRIAEENAGDAGGDGGGGLFGTVLCTLAYEKGDLSEEIWKADARYGKSVHPDVLAGYRAWAVPLARQARKHEWIYRIVKPLIVHWANQMHRESAPSLSFYGIAYDWRGWVLGAIGRPLCKAIGWSLRKKHGFSTT